MPKLTIALEIAANVRARRKQVGMTRKQLAKAADVSERYLSELENGAANASIGILARIADALGTHVPELLSAPTTDRGAAPMPPTPLIAPLDELNRRLECLSSTDQQAALEHLKRWLDERRRSWRGVALLGLRGAGKTTIGTTLAQRLHVPFISITREIEARAGMSLGDLFNLGGQDAYRALEDEVIADLVRREDLIVLETAGGIVGNPAALGRVLDRFKSVWIKASPKEHLDRVVQQGDVRPIRGNPKALEHLESLLAVRQSEYARAEHVLDTSGRSIEVCVAELEAILAPLRT